MPRLISAVVALVVAPLFAEPSGVSVVVDSPSVARPAAPGVALLEGRRVLVLGDSITQDGAYVSFIEYLLLRAYPEKHFDIVSVGLASETVSGLSEPEHAGGRFARPDLKKRLARALAEVKPGVVIACYGMNDGIYVPYDESRMQAFRAGVIALAASCEAAGAKLVLVTPPVYDEWRAQHIPYDTEVLSRFAAWEVASAPKSVSAVVDLHTAMRAELLARRRADAAFRFAPDLIHPDRVGHLFMARTILESLGVTRSSAEATEAMLARITADPVWGEVHRRRAERSAAWLEHIGYEREKTVRPGTGDIVAAERLAESRRLALIKRRP